MCNWALCSVIMIKVSSWKPTTGDFAIRVNKYERGYITTERKIMLLVLKETEVDESNSSKREAFNCLSCG